MTEKVPLEAMLRRASRMAENMFERDGEVTAFGSPRRRTGGLPRQGRHQAIGEPLVIGWPGDDGPHHDE